MNATVSVLLICRERLGEPVAHLVTRETGQRVRAAIARALEELEPGGVLTLDFTGVGVVDFSCADEFLAKLVTRLIAGEYGERYLRLTGLGPSQRENLQVALERKKLPALHVGPDGFWECLGVLKPYLGETLRVVVARGRISAREMAGLLGLELTASSTRLINLHRQRLVSRRERAMGEGGREFLYESLLDGAAEAEPVAAGKPSHG